MRKRQMLEGQMWEIQMHGIRTHEIQPWVRQIRKMKFLGNRVCEKQMQEYGRGRMADE
ncbi:MAG: hypothetical protein LUI87_13825 [Lachnospiraceae bacterium]|nr:hypothetical protein [Lachnospiraceae bacterium]